MCRQTGRCCRCRRCRCCRSRLCCGSCRWTAGAAAVEQPGWPWRRTWLGCYTTRGVAGTDTGRHTRKRALQAGEERRLEHTQRHTQPHARKAACLPAAYLEVPQPRCWEARRVSDFGACTGAYQGPERHSVGAGRLHATYTGTITRGRTENGVRAAKTACMQRVLPRRIFGVSTLRVSRRGTLLPCRRPATVRRARPHLFTGSAPA